MFEPEAGRFLITTSIGFPQKAFNSLAQDEQGWNFHPQQFIPGTPGAGMGAIPPAVRWVLDSQRSARRYLEKRHLPRLRIPWDEIKEVKARLVVDR